MKITLVKDYSRLSDPNLEFRAQAVITLLTGNANYADTIPTLANFTAVKEAYSTALANTVTSDRISVGVKNDARAQLLLVMKQMALSVESFTPGDRTKLISSGFDLASEGEGVPPLTAPTGFRLVDGVNPGEVKFIVKRTPNAMSYQHEYTLEPVTENSKWISKATTSKEFLFVGLPSGSRIFGRTIAIGRKGQEACSNILSRVVQ